MQVTITHQAVLVPACKLGKFDTYLLRVIVPRVFLWCRNALTVTSEQGDSGET